MGKSRPHAKQAQEHIEELELAYQQARAADPERANRYLALIRRIAMKFRLKLSRDVKHSYCKHCKEAFIPGKNCRMRTRDGQVVFYCFTCKNYTRIPLSKNK